MVQYSSNGPPQKVYRGEIASVGEQRIVTVNGAPLDFALDVANHSPTGLNWGYGGAGPHQLSIALLVDCLHDNFEMSWTHAIEPWIQKLNQEESWTITEREIGRMLTDYALEDLTKRRGLFTVLKRLGL